ncbi:Transcription factor Adf-1 [Chionoecetes opilio]|uniref:Transcription factor Adf-1 n=1 Tax=Chionoecetes opilio TaxID=41210 RepID=A0A8J4Y8A5_CHIOP|nr:Transcription factor Adf-1 [Chionoecetes opilio]
MEKLIEEVRKCPCLYDMRLEEYRDLQRKDNCWERIAQNLHRNNSRSVKQDWKKLRDCFRQAVARRKTSGQAAKHWKAWRYEKQMQFLIPFMNSRETSTSIENIPSDGVQDEDDTGATHARDTLEEMAAAASTSQDGGICGRQKRKPATTSDVDKLITCLHDTQAMSEQRDDLDYFFMSACHSTRRLPRRLQTQIKREVLDCIARAEEQHENDMSVHASTPSPAPPCSGVAVSNDSNSSFSSAQGSGVTDQSTEARPLSVVSTEVTQTATAYGRPM